MKGTDDQCGLTEESGRHPSRALGPSWPPRRQTLLGNSGGRVIRREASVERLLVNDGVKVGFRGRRPRTGCISEARCHGGPGDR